mgnify:CR=1 FL=1
MPDEPRDHPATLAAQALGLVVAIAWALGVGLLLFKMLDLTMGLRASEEEEDQGLDEPEHGTLAYPEMAPQTGGIAPDPAEAD